VSTCHLEPSRRLWCTVASRHCCPPASAARLCLLLAALPIGEIPAMPHTKVLHTTLYEMPSHPFACLLTCEPLASLIAAEASCRPTAPVNRYQGRCTAMMPAPSTRRQGLT
jgi:hypothetical protein